MLSYGVSADEAHKFGLPCGGTIELLIEPDPELESLNTLVTSLSAGRLMRRKVQISDGRVELTRTDEPDELVVTPTTVTSTFGPEFRMLLIGAGQLTEYLATMASFSGFAVTVCDPRSEYSISPALSMVKLSRNMPDDEVLAFKPDRRSVVIALTHDPKLDDLALLEALNADALYVGAIGSRRNTEARRRRLHEHFDIPKIALDKMHAPVGLFIGSKTPAEIAISIMAEVVAVKNGVDVARADKVAPAKERLDRLRLVASNDAAGACFQ